MGRWFAMLLDSVVGWLRATISFPLTLKSGSALFAELDSLPVGLEVIHSPARVGSPVGPDRGWWPYRWRFRTDVRAIDRPLTILYFGIGAWDGKQWIMPANNRRYNAGILNQKKFMEWYHCPGARIEPDKPAVDPENWAGSRTRAPFRQKWFFVGKDDQGTLYKGEAVVMLLDGD